MMAISNLLRIVAPLYLMCAPQDVAVVYQVKCPFTDRPTLILYDNCPGGVGLAAKAYGMQRLLLEKALQIVSGLPLRAGLSLLCGSCRRNRHGRQGHLQAAAEGADLMPLSLRDKLRAVDAPKKPSSAAPQAPVFDDCWHGSKLFPLESGPRRVGYSHGHGAADGVRRAPGTPLPGTHSLSGYGNHRPQRRRGNGCVSDRTGISDGERLSGASIPYA